MTTAPKNLNHVVDQDSSVAFESPTIDLERPVEAIQYQIAWDASVLGVFTFQATIYDDLWEDIPGCSIEVWTSGQEAGHKIVAIPKTWITAAKLRFKWEPDASGSSGNINAAIRISSV